MNAYNFTMSDHPAVCLTCGKPRPKPKKGTSTDHYGRPMVFCGSPCFDAYEKKKPRA